MFTWLNASMTRKISSLSFVLLAFLFIVILYTAYKSQKIHKDIQEVSKIDIPLLEVIADIEILQLKQHLQMETIRLKGDAFFKSEALKSKSVKRFNEFNYQLSVQLDKAVNILHQGMKFGSVRIGVDEHLSLIEQINKLHSHRIAFEDEFSQFIKSDHTGYESSWEALEKQDNLLDDEANDLLINIDQLTVKVASLVEQQELDFMIMNAILGLSALVIGGYLTLYTILSFRRKVGALRGQIETLHRTISPDEDSHISRHQGSDELDELERDLKLLMGRLFLEKENRDEVETQLLELATRDKLTGVFNRHKWDEHIKDELALANRGHHFSLILLDVDHFKKINDTYGHDVGDTVLKLLVKVLKRRLRETDILFRVGGEEFAILLRDTHLEDASRLAEQLRRKVEAIDEDNVPQFTISLGVTEYQNSDNQKSIVKRADVLLYEAKDAGRNSVFSG